MVTITPIRPVEGVEIDRTRLNRLRRRMGPRGLDAALDEALQELAERLYHCDADRQTRAEMERNARRVAEIARITGLVTVGRVAGELAAVCAAGPETARAALAARLTRLGEASILRLWDLQDVTV